MLLTSGTINMQLLYESVKLYFNLSFYSQLDPLGKVPFAKFQKIHVDCAGVQRVQDAAFLLIFIWIVHATSVILYNESKSITKTCMKLKHALYINMHYTL